MNFSRITECLCVISFDKMAFRTKLEFLLGISLGFLVTLSVQNDMCGMAAPDPAKTCVSIRLPWSQAPMYFCTEKNKFRYRKQCQNRMSSLCGVNTMHSDALMVAAPWDCCPLMSYPDSCANQHCAPAPLNRKCQTMEPKPDQPWECCNSYFCEENMTPETCHFKRLEPSCNMPPKDKKNCVAFIDPYGCCPKFQCDGDSTAKPGHCPAQAEAMKFMARFNSTNMMMMVPGGGPMMMHPGMGMNGNSMGAGMSSPAGQAEMHMENKPVENPQNAAPAPGPDPAPAPPAEAAPPPPPAEGEAPPPAAERIAPGLHLAGHFGRQGALISVMPNNHHRNQIACVGDFNCPMNMKCCSNDMNVYVHEGTYFFRNMNPTYGYCMEPVMNANTNMPMNTKAVRP